MKTTLAAIIIGGLTISTATLRADDKIPPPPPANDSKNAAPSGSASARSEGRGGLLMELKNGGRISKEEFLAHARKEAEERFEKIDTNHDGYIDKAEAEAAMKRLRERSQQGDGSAREKLKERMQNRGESKSGTRQRPQADDKKPTT